MTGFQIQLLSFQEKCNKCLNRSEVKLMRGREKKPIDFFFSCTAVAFICFMLWGQLYSWDLERIIHKARRCGKNRKMATL